MTNPTVVALAWEPSGYDLESPYDDPYAINNGLGAPSDTMFLTEQTNLFEGLSSSSFFGVIGQYSSAGGSITLWNHQTYTDTTPFPGGRGTQSNPLQDSDIQSEINHFISSHGSPTGTNVGYFVYIPSGVYECTSFGCTFSDFCGYHGSFTSGSATVLYALLADPAEQSGCLISGISNYPYGPTGDQVGDSVASVASHELFEMATDEQQNAWYDANGYEIGDKCAWTWDNQPDADLADVFLGGVPYWLQSEYSNSLTYCWMPSMSTAPIPYLASVQYQPTIDLGQSDTITVTVSNHGGQAAWQTISIATTAPVLANSFTVVSSTLPTTPTLVPAGSPLTTGCYGLCSPSTTTLYDYIQGEAAPWPSGATYNSVAQYNSAGTGDSGTWAIYVKSVASVQAGTAATDWAPSSGTSDQQGEYVSVYPLTINPTLAISTPTASPGAVDVGQPVTFSSSASGGTPGYTYSWTGLPTGCSSSNSASISCTPTQSGQFSVQAHVQDSIGGTSTSGSLVFAVSTDPIASTPTVTPSAVDVNQPVSFATTVTGGSGGNSFVWHGLPTGCATSNAATLPCTPSAAGTFSVSVTATDSNGGVSTSGAAGLTVSSDPLASVPVANLTPIDFNRAVSFSTSASGGVGPYSYAWTQSSSTLGCSLVNSPTIACDPTNAGTGFSVSVVVSDANGWHSSTESLTFNVIAAYQVTFAESGLPTGTQWWVNLTGGPSLTTTGSSVSTWLTNGTYPYKIATTNKEYASPKNSVTVNGAAETQPVPFSLVTYTITFTESGLPSGTLWSVGIGVPTISSTTTTVVFTKPNGSYSFQVYSVTHYSVSPSIGSVTVHGANVGKAITYTYLSGSPKSYTVLATEYMGPMGQTWSMTLGGVKESTPVPGQLSFQVTNGTYYYTVPTINVSCFTYTPSPASGFVVVSGSGMGVPITFGERGHCGLPAATPASLGPSTSSAVSLVRPTLVPTGTVVLAMVLLGSLVLARPSRKRGFSAVVKSPRTSDRIDRRDSRSSK